LMIKILLLNISDLDTLSRVFCLHLRICLSPII